MFTELELEAKRVPNIARLVVALFACALIVAAIGCRSKRPTLGQIESYVNEITMRHNDALSHQSGSDNPYSFSALYTPRSLKQPYVTAAQMEQALGRASSKAEESLDGGFTLSWSTAEENGSLKAKFDRGDGTLQHLEFETPHGALGTPGRESISRSVEGWKWEEYAHQ